MDDLDENKDTNFTSIEESPKKKGKLELSMVFRVSELDIPFSKLTVETGTPKIGAVVDVHTPILSSKSLTFGFQK
jgi:hypothetical protein